LITLPRLLRHLSPAAVTNSTCMARMAGTIGAASNNSSGVAA
jgi:hypothetical protein